MTICNKKVYEKNNRYFKIGSDGVSIEFKGLEAMAAKRLLDKKINLNMKKAFSWSAMSFFAIAPPKIKNEKKIAEYYGKFGFKNHRGNCYVQAYTFYWMARTLGENVRVIRGYILTSNGLSPHSWCEIMRTGGKIWAYDPNFNSEYSTKLKNPNAGYRFQYGDKKTLTYYDEKKKALQ